MPPKPPKRKASYSHKAKKRRAKNKIKNEDKVLQEERESIEAVEAFAKNTIHQNSVSTTLFDDASLLDIENFIRGELDEDYDEPTCLVDDYIEEKVLKESLEESNNPLKLLETVMGKTKALRMHIASHFILKFKMDTNREKWKGKNGIMKKIKKDLELPSHIRIENILEDVLWYAARGKKYAGQTKKSNCGRKGMISLDSEEAQVIADIVELGGSYKQAWRTVNQHRKENNEPSLTLSAVISLIKRLEPILETVETRKQGSACNKSSKICRARKLWCLQLGVIFGVIDFEEFKKSNEEYKNKETPPWFEKEKLNCIDKYDVLWFDEVHRQCSPGTSAKNSVIVTKSRKKLPSFRRDANGKLSKKGKVQKRRVAQMRVKYNSEGRFCFGVGANKIKKDGEEIKEGFRCEVFDYTGQLMVTPKDYEKHIQTEIRRVKSLKKGGEWVKKSNPKDIYRNDLVSKLKHIGKAAVMKLEPLQITYVKDLKYLPQAKRDDIKKILGKNFESVMVQANACLELERTEIDYRKAENPYEARYGTEWREKIKKVTYMKQFRDIRELVDHMVSECKKNGKKYFYHDALSLLTSNDTMQYMREKNVLKMWLCPQLGLFEDQPDLKSYYGRPPGNSAELMPLDTTLNKDIHEAVNAHVLLTNTLDPDDERRFGLATPTQVSSSYRRIFDPTTGVAPSSVRIVQDIDKVFRSIIEIVDDDGLVTSKSCANSWRTKLVSKESKKKEKRTNRGKRLLDPNNYGEKGVVIHPDALAGQKVKLEESKKLYEGALVDAQKAIAEANEDFTSSLETFDDEEEEEENGVVEM